MKFIASCDYIPPSGEDYTDIEMVVEPDQCPSMREIVARFVQGLELGVNTYDYYDDDEPYFDLGMDRLDAIDYERSFTKSTNERYENELRDLSSKQNVGEDNAGTVSE